MAIIKNEIPILEYDDNPHSVLMPNHEKLNLKLPQKAVFAFLGDWIDEYARQHDCKFVGTFESATQILDWLISYGVKEVISAGSCGALIDIPENTFLVPIKALRDEGTSYHYLPPSRYVDLNPSALKAIEQTLNQHHYSYIECIAWTTDGFFRETKDKVEYRRNEGCG